MGDLVDIELQAEGNGPIVAASCNFCRSVYLSQVVKDVVQWSLGHVHPEHPKVLIAELVTPAIGYTGQ